MTIKSTDVCARLKEERIRLGLSQGHIADVCGVAVKTVGRWERNIPLPSDKLAKLIPFGFDITYILSDVRFGAPGKTSSSLQHQGDIEQHPVALSEEQQLWLKIIENLTNGKTVNIREIGLALVGYSQTKHPD